MKLSWCLLLLINLVYAEASNPQLIMEQQAAQIATNRINLQQIQAQQNSVNQINIVAGKIFTVTGIPSWRSTVFVRQSTTENGVVDFSVLVTQINNYLINHNHNQMSAGQVQQLSKLINN